MSQRINDRDIESRIFIDTTLYSSFSQITRENVSSELLELVGFQDAVSGAAEPILPITIRIADKTGATLEFTLLINPDNMNHGKTHSTYFNYTRQGYVTQSWGPNQDLITATGKTAAFMVPGTGLTDASERSSVSFHNIMALLATYRNNGYNLIDPLALQTEVTRVTNLVHGACILYDGQEFYGHFNNFTLDNSADSPFTFSYNFEFVVTSLSSNFINVRGHFSEIGKIIPEEKIPVYISAPLVDVPDIDAEAEVNIYDTSTLITTIGLDTEQKRNNFRISSKRIERYGYDPYFEESSKVYGTNIDLAKGQMTTESGVDPYAISEAGAKGAIQFMPETAKAQWKKDPYLQQQFPNGPELFNPRFSVLANGSLMKDLLAKYGNTKLALAAYNAGEPRIDKYLRHVGDPLTEETILYPDIVLGYANAYAQTGTGTTVAQSTSQTKTTRYAPVTPGKDTNNFSISTKGPKGKMLAYQRNLVKKGKG